MLLELLEHLLSFTKPKAKLVPKKNNPYFDSYMIFYDITIHIV